MKFRETPEVKFCVATQSEVRAEEITARVKFAPAGQVMDKDNKKGIIPLRIMGSLDKLGMTYD